MYKLFFCLSHEGVSMGLKINDLSKQFQLGITANLKFGQWHQNASFVKPQETVTYSSVFCKLYFRQTTPASAGVLVEQKYC